MTQVYGHRGASGNFPENTLEAFEAAIAMGVHGVELDVRRAADDSVVVLHDAHLADGRAIVDLDRASLPDEVPDLAAVLDLCVDITVNVEIKVGRKDPDYDPDGAIVALTADVCRQAGAIDRVIITSFDRPSIDAMRTVLPEVRTGLISMLPVDLGELAAEGHGGFMPFCGVVAEQLVTEAHDLGLFVGTWTANAPELITAVAAAGVDAVLTDYPDRALELLGR